MIIHHLGFLTKDLERTVMAFKSLSMIELCRVTDDLRQVQLIFLSTPSRQIIEIISPTSKNSIVANIIDKFSNSVYHICYESTNLESDINDLEKKGFIVLIPPQIAVAFNNNRVVFLFNENCGIIELVEKRYESSLFK